MGLLDKFNKKKMANTTAQTARNSQDTNADSNERQYVYLGGTLLVKAEPFAGYAVVLVDPRIIIPNVDAEKLPSLRDRLLPVVAVNSTLMMNGRVSQVSPIMATVVAMDQFDSEVAKKYPTSFALVFPVGDGDPPSLTYKDSTNVTLAFTTTDLMVLTNSINVGLSYEPTNQSRVSFIKEI